jgi:hypothetical protein
MANNDSKFEDAIGKYVMDAEQKSDDQSQPASAKKAAEPQEKKIENCAELLNNVYHVHAPAPKNKADRSIEAMRAARKAESKGSKTKSSKGSKKK